MQQKLPNFEKFRTLLLKYDEIEEVTTNIRNDQAHSMQGRSMQVQTTIFGRGRGASHINGKEEDNHHLIREDMLQDIIVMGMKFMQEGIFVLEETICERLTQIQ